MEIFYSTGMGERSGSNIPSRKLINGACSRDPAVILIDQPKDFYDRRRARDRRYHAMVPPGHAQGLYRRHVVSETRPTTSTSNSTRIMSAVPSGTSVAIASGSLTSGSMGN